MRGERMEKMIRKRGGKKRKERENENQKDEKTQNKTEKGKK